MSFQQVELQQLTVPAAVSPASASGTTLMPPERSSASTSVGSGQAHTAISSGSRRGKQRTTARPSSSAQGSSIQPPRTPQPPHFDPEAVFRTAFPLRDKNIPELFDCDYDSLALYQVTPDEEAEKVRREIARLIEVVQRPENDLIFTSEHDDSLPGLVASEDGYAALAKVAALVTRALRICNADNNGISLLNAGLDQTSQSFRTDLARLSPDYDLDVKESEQRRHGSAVPGQSHQEAPTTEPSQHACADLVDYLTASIIQLMMQIANGDTWHNSILAVMAKTAAKIKVLLEDVESHTTASRTNGESVLESYIATFGEDKLDDKNKKKKAQMAAREMLQSDGPGGFRKHCVEQQRIRSLPVKMLGYLLACIATPKNSEGSDVSISAYEMVGAVIDTGYEGFKTALSQDRDFEFSSTSDLDDLNFAHPAFNMLIASANLIQTRRNSHSSPPPPPTSSSSGPTSSSLTTTVEWSYSRDLDHSSPPSPPKLALSTLSLRNLAEVVTIMVPLLLTTPYISNALKAYFNMFYLTTDIGGEVRPYTETPYTVFVRLHTSAYKFRSDMGGRESVHKVLPLADAIHGGFFSRDFLLGDVHGGGISTVGGTPGLSVPLAGNPRFTSWVPAWILVPRRWIPFFNSGPEDLASQMRRMAEWVYVENAVVVSCRQRVWFTMTAAAILVFGGLAIGLTLNERLEGVDPFNITVYLWAVAAFLVLVVRSLSVCNWDWGDFLRGKARCRSVSELASLTGCHEQLVLAKLLHDEQESILTTRGPYNSVFARRAEKGDADGFSIDVPVRARTMLLSGLTMLKVETPLGHGLVCLDARRGTGYSVVTHVGVSNKGDDELICQDIDRLRMSDNVKNSGAPTVSLPMKWSKEMQWRRVEGVYAALDAAFV